MEGETASEAEDKMRPPKPGEEDSTVLDTALEVGRDGLLLCVTVLTALPAWQHLSKEIAKIAEVADNPAGEKPFLFLELPPEVRNMIYQQSCIYETPGSEMIPDPLIFPDLRQPSITRVNKQIRNETLPIFYGNNDFWINISWPSGSSNIGHDRFKHVWDLLHSFATAPAPQAEIKMQTSSLRFLTLLSFRVDENFESDDTTVVLGFTMSSRRLLAGKWDYYIQTKNLDWERFPKVKEAYVAGIEDAIEEEAIGFNDVLLLCGHRCLEVDTRIDELVSLMCYMAKQCPQLTSTVLGSVKNYEDFGSDMSD